MTKSHRTTQILLDRVQHAVSTHTGKDIKRTQALDIMAQAFGYHNTHELTQAMRTSDRHTPPKAILVGTIMIDGVDSLIVRDPVANATYTIEESFVEQVIDAKRREYFGVSPYGTLLDLRPLLTTTPTSPHTPKASDTPTIIEAVMKRLKTPDWVLEEAGTQHSYTFSMDITVFDPMTVWTHAVRTFVAGQADIHAPATEAAVTDIMEAMSMILDSMEAAITTIHDPGAPAPGLLIEDSGSNLITMPG